MRYQKITIDRVTAIYLFFNLPNIIKARSDPYIETFS